MQTLVSILGLAVMILIAWSISVDRRRINWRIVLGGLGLQFAAALFILRTRPGRAIFDWAGGLFRATIEHVEAGSTFMFGVFPQPTDAPLPPSYALMRTFAFGVLPTIVFFSSLMSILYHLGVMQRIVEWIARIMQRTLATSGAESLSTAANIFVGQTEAPLVIRPYISTMTQSELNAVMVGGFATVAGGVMAAYVQMGIDAGHLMTASVISAPAALLIAKLMVPETGEPNTLGHVHIEVEKTSVNLVEAAAVGATDGMKLAINVAAMLIAFIALLSLGNGLLGWCGDRWYGLTTHWLDWPAGETWTLERLFGFAFYPFAWVMGIPSVDCSRAAELLGIRTVGNEFIAYDSLSRWTQDASKPQPRTVLILTYALSGFANFSSIGIQIGGISVIAPDRRADLARLGIRAMIGGTLATFMTACIAGILIDEPSGSASERLPNTDVQLNSKRIGNSAVNEVAMSLLRSSASTRRIGRSSQNSARTWRQAPHGVTAPGAATTRWLNDFAPMEMALNRAVRSAQIVRPREVFSTLHPTWIRPCASSSAAPTANWLIGTWANCRTCRARSMSCLTFSFTV